MTIDTLRADRLGAYGARDAETPHLDRLARGGVLFENARSPVPLTLPAHATILSGLEPPSHGVRDNGGGALPDDVPTLPTALKARGYATGAFVGAYVLHRRFGLARGFDRYDDRVERRPRGASALEAERSCEAVAAAAAEWLRERNGPFLAWVHFYDPHAPYEPPPPWRERFAARPYEGEIAYTDSCFGRLLDAAEKAATRLVVAVIGDHGEALGEHDESTHGFFVYEPTLRVPLLLAGVGLPQGARRAGLARATDLMPTLLAHLRVPVPASLDGADLMTGPPRDEAYAESLYPRQFGWAELRSLRRGRLKYIDAPRPELYDVVTDPAEARSLLPERGADAAPFTRTLAMLKSKERRAMAALDREASERLRSLGYVAGTAGAATPAAKDPKDALPEFRAFEESLAAEARGDAEGALRLLRGLVSRAPENAAFRRNLAALLRRARRPAEALAELRALVGAQPKDAQAWHELSVAASEAGWTAEALHAAEQATQFDPSFAEAWNQRGILEAGRHRAEVAVRAFERAEALDAANARAVVNRGNALRALGRRREAEGAYRHAAELAPDDPDVWNGLGAIASEDRRYEEAVRHFERALALDPGLTEARANLEQAERERRHQAGRR